MSLRAKGPLTALDKRHNPNPTGPSTIAPLPISLTSLCTTHSSLSSTGPSNTEPFLFLQETMSVLVYEASQTLMDNSAQVLLSQKAISNAPDWVRLPAMALVPKH